MKKIINMTLLSTALAFIGLWGCNDPDLIPEVLIPEYSVIDGDTIKTRNDNFARGQLKKNVNYSLYGIQEDTVLAYRDPGMRRNPNSKVVDPLKRKDNNGKFRMACLGGATAAGYRDGGYFNEGIRTSFPAIVANQMGIDFNQPEFDKNDYNGIGRIVRTERNISGGPVPKFNVTKNNTAILNSEGKYLELKPNNKKVTIDNLAFWNAVAGMVNNTSNLAFENSNDYTSYSDLTTKLYRRIFDKEGKETIYTKLNSKYDFLIVGFDPLYSYYEFEPYSDIDFSKLLKFDQSQYIENDDWATSLSNPQNYEVDPMVGLLYRLNEKIGLSRGVLYNYPNPYDFPYFNTFSEEDVRKVMGSTRVYYSESQWYGDLGLLPTSEIDSLLSPKVNIALKPGVNRDRPISRKSILTDESRNGQLKGFERYTVMVKQLSEKYDFAMVDLYALYTKILKGEYRTDDGIYADPRWPEGNFFSADGIYPTAFGQAIIANETIKAINSKYGTAIPLVQTSQFLNY